MTLDNLKQEVLSQLDEADINLKDPVSGVFFAINYLHTQGRIVPDDYVAVPMEPTEDMVGAYNDIVVDCRLTDVVNPKMAWHVMVAAAQNGDVK